MLTTMGDQLSDASATLYEAGYPVEAETMQRAVADWNISAQAIAEQFWPTHYFAVPVGVYSLALRFVDACLTYEHPVLLAGWIDRLFPKAKELKPLPSFADFMHPELGAPSLNYPGTAREWLAKAEKERRWLLKNAAAMRRTFAERGLLPGTNDPEHIMPENAIRVLRCQGLSHKKIADRLGLDEETVRKSLSRTSPPEQPEI